MRYYKYLQVLLLSYSLVSDTIRVRARTQCDPQLIQLINRTCCCLRSVLEIASPRSEKMTCRSLYLGTGFSAVKHGTTPNLNSEDKRNMKNIHVLPDRVVVTVITSFTFC